MYSWLSIARDNTWQERQKQADKGKPRPAGQEIEPGTMTKNPGEIANELKTHSKDYDHAQSRLNNFVNRRGESKRDGATNQRLDQAKDALKQAYGVQTPKKPVEPAKPATPATSRLLSVAPIERETPKAKASILVPPGFDQNADEPILDVGIERPGVRASQRLKAADNWSEGVKTKKKAPEGMFKKSAADIAKYLHDSHEDLESANGALQFYLNRGGKNLDPADRKRIESVGPKLKKLFH